MDDILKDFLTQKSDQIARAHTMAELSYNNIQATNAEIKVGFAKLGEKIESFHVNFVTASLYNQQRLEILEMLAKLEKEVRDEHKANDETRGMIKKGLGALGVIIFVATLILK